MRSKLNWTLALAAAISVSVSAAALAAGGEKPAVVEAGNLVVTFNGGVKPTTLPKNSFAPITLHVSGGIKTKDGSQPPALREVIVDSDKNGAINPKGLATCTASKITATNTQAAKKACPKAIVGSGKVSVRVAFPESTPFEANGPLVVFNGGEKGGTTTLLIHAYVSVPTATAIVTTVKIRKEHRGRYGLRSIASIPVIAGGSGSVTSFELTIGKTFTYKGRQQSYLEAKCATGSFAAEADAIFEGGTEAKGSVIRTCKAKG